MGELSTPLAVLLAILAVLVVVPRLAGMAARFGIWVSGRVSGPERLYEEGRIDEGRLPRHGRARTELAPRGKVFVSGELWDAEVADDGERVAAGGRVEVLSRRGLVLRVRPAPEAADPTTPVGSAGKNIE